MRQLTKAEACRELAMSLSTLDRRIASGDIQVRREQRGSRHRIYVMLDEPPENGANARSQGTLLDVAQERIRGLDEQVELLQAQLALEQERNVGLEEVYRKERGKRDRMRRVAFILGLVATGLFRAAGHQRFRGVAVSLEDSADPFDVIVVWRPA